jgi:hypothetical protein
MSTDIDHPRGEYSHGTIVCGKGLVQLGHPSAYARSFLDQIDLVTHVGEINGNLHPGYAAADD